MTISHRSLGSMLAVALLVVAAFYDICCTRIKTKWVAIINPDLNGIFEIDEYRLNDLYSNEYIFRHDSKKIVETKMCAMPESKHRLMYFSTHSYKGVNILHSSSYEGLIVRTKNTDGSNGILLFIPEKKSMSKDIVSKIDLALNNAGSLNFKCMVVTEADDQKYVRRKAIQNINITIEMLDAYFVKHCKSNNRNCVAVRQALKVMKPNSRLFRSND